MSGALSIHICVEGIFQQADPDACCIVNHFRNIHSVRPQVSAHHAKYKGGMVTIRIANLIELLRPKGQVTPLDPEQIEEIETQLVRGRTTYVMLER